MMVYHSIQDILNLCEAKHLSFWQVIQRADMEERCVSEEESYQKMKSMYLAMKHADESYDASLVSASGLVGGDGEKMHLYNQSGKNICGDFIGTVMEKAIKMAESNACMRRIVAAPTAGSCGVIPAVFLTAEQMLSIPEEQMIAAMYISAGIGAVIAENASIAGAVNAVTSAGLALAGINSAIPADEVIDAMRRIGNDMPASIKETGQGGLATSPTALNIRKQL